MTAHRFLCERRDVTKKKKKKKEHENPFSWWKIDREFLVDNNLNSTNWNRRKGKKKRYRKLPRVCSTGVNDDAPARVCAIPLISCLSWDWLAERCVFDRCEFFPLPLTEFPVFVLLLDGTCKRIVLMCLSSTCCQKNEYFVVVFFAMNDFVSIRSFEVRRESKRAAQKRKNEKKRKTSSR